MFSVQLLRSIGSGCAAFVSNRTSRLQLILAAATLLCSTTILGWFVTTLLIADRTKIYIDCVLCGFQLYAVFAAILYGVIRRTQMLPTLRSSMIQTCSVITSHLTITAAYYCCSIITLFFLTETWCWFLWPAYATIAVVGLFLQASSLSLMTVMHPMLGTISLLGWYGICYAAPYVPHDYWLVPDLSRLDITAAVMNELPYDVGRVIQEIKYLIMYSVGLHVSTMAIVYTRGENLAMLKELLLGLCCASPSENTRRLPSATITNQTCVKQSIVVTFAYEEMIAVPPLGLTLPSPIRMTGNYDNRQITILPSEKITITPNLWLHKKGDALEPTKINGVQIPHGYTHFVLQNSTTGLVIRPVQKDYFAKND